MKILPRLVKIWKKLKLNLSRNALFHIKTGVCLKYFVNDCFFLQTRHRPDQISYLWQYLYGFWHSFDLKLEELICKKVLKLVLVDNYFPYPFCPVQIWHWKLFKFALWHSFRKIKLIPAKIWLFSTTEAINNDIKSWI